MCDDTCSHEHDCNDLHLVCSTSRFTEKPIDQGTASIPYYVADAASCHLLPFGLLICGLKVDHRVFVPDVRLHLLYRSLLI
ncbi:MAG: hypothetical protein ACRC2T_02065 [Thermoguttaceae bacterium]